MAPQNEPDKCRVTRVYQRTDDEEHFDDDVADDGRAPLVGAFHRDERGVVWHHDGHVERAQQYQPVPADLEDAVVQQDEARPLDLLHLVLGHRRAGQVLDLRLYHLGM